MVFLGVLEKTFSPEYQWLSLHVDFLVVVFCHGYCVLLVDDGGGLLVLPPHSGAYFVLGHIHMSVAVVVSGDSRHGGGYSL
ncbi:hypothetical protein M0R45_015088 [Rubus argutus]|uniref:Transmembrane protein n=1 Tax=Rubus argutus TaxID=59490 RepID=A0AAW1XN77_RUBAR